MGIANMVLLRRNTYESFTYKQQYPMDVQQTWPWTFCGVNMVKKTALGFFGKEGVHHMCECDNWLTISSGTCNEVKVSAIIQGGRVSSFPILEKFM